MERHSHSTEPVPVAVDQLWNMFHNCAIATRTPPPFGPCASPPTFSSPYEPYNFRANHETRACVEVRRDCRVCPAAPHPARRDDMPAFVTTCRHRLPGRSVEPPPSQPVACRAGRDVTPHGGRTSGRVQRWHEKCLMSVQHPRSTPCEAMLFRKFQPRRGRTMGHVPPAYG